MIDVGKMLREHSPEILTGIGVAGVAITTFLTAKATLKCSDVLRDENMSVKEKAKECWKDYIPAGLTGVMTVTCIISGNKICLKRNAALAAAAKLSEAAFMEYRAKTLEVMGEHQEKKIYDAIAKDKVERTPINTTEVIVTGKGTTRCMDGINERYFESDLETIRQKVNSLNYRMLTEMFISLNEYYYELGLKPAKDGDDIGWFVEDGLIELRHPSAAVCDDGVPCLVIEPNRPPRARH